MNDQSDDAQFHALMVLAGVIALVVGGVLTLAIWRTATRPGLPSQTAVPAPASTALGDAQGQIFFELRSAALPEDAQSVLGQVADAARADASKVVLISGFHDVDGATAENDELANRRAETVRHALEADGVTADHLVLDKPMATTGGGDPRDGRRVELRLR